MKLSASDYLPIAIQRQGFQTAELSYAFVKPDGSQIDQGARPPRDFNLKEEILRGLVKILTKTDFTEWHNKEVATHTSYFYNSSSRQLVGNYENWAFSQPAKDWRLTTSRCTLEDLETLMEMGWRMSVGATSILYGTSLPAVLLVLGEV